MECLGLKLWGYSLVSSLRVRGQGLGQGVRNEQLLYMEVVEGVKGKYSEPEKTEMRSWVLGKDTFEGLCLFKYSNFMLFDKGGKSIFS